MVFSHEPDKSSVERHFSLYDDNGRIKGSFIWEDKKMIFVPFAPLETNTNYTINLSAETHDTGGLNMDAPFEGKFTTRPGNTRPVLLSCYPATYTEVIDPRTEVRLVFSLPVQLDTLYDNVSFTPSMTGFWQLEKNGNLAIFTPAEPWLQNKRYEIRVSAALTDKTGINMGKEFISIFTTGTDHEAPYLVNASRIMKNGGYKPLALDISNFIYGTETLVETHDWEKDDRLSLVFSKPVDGISVKNCLSVEGAPNLVMETEPDYKNEFLFHFETRPTYESRFVFRLKSGIKDSAGNESKNEYVYRVFANGKLSKPPALAGIRMPMAPGSETDYELAGFGIDSVFEYLPIKDGRNNYPSNESVKTWIELYFDTAEGASIDAFSVMELFRIETSNSVLNFSPRQVKTSGFSAGEKHPLWKNMERIEIAGVLTNTVNFGVVNFLVASGLKDSLGNKNEKSFRISLIK
jgi:hypothetical protein